MKTKTCALISAALLLLTCPPAQAFYNPTTGRWLSRDPGGESAGINMLCFVHNNPAVNWDAFGLLTATGGTIHTSFIEHNNYLTFNITCPKCTEFLFQSVDYTGVLSGLHALGLNDEMLGDAFGRDFDARELGDFKDAKTPNCLGQPVAVQVYMRSRLAYGPYLLGLWLLLHADDGFPRLSESQTTGAYSAGTVINYDCVECGGPAAPWWP